MITAIEVAATASFGDDVARLNELGHVNVVFGSNGTGKTTISRVMAAPTDYPGCSLRWSGPEPLQCWVYNQEFIAKNFDESSELKGIFTLGEEQIGTRRKIELANTRVTELTDTVRGLSTALDGEDGTGGKRGELTRLDERLRSKCWAQKQKYDDRFADAFTGFRNSQSRFFEKVLEEQHVVGTAARPIEDLESRAETVFGQTPTECSLLPLPDFESLLGHEGHAVLTKAVVGKADVDIADMIERLGNSDWVQRGRSFFDVNDGDCPFCQQEVSDGFAASLERYFDATFEADTRAIAELLASYQADAQSVVEALEGIGKSAQRFLDHELLKSHLDVLSALTTQNVATLQVKEAEPSRKVTLTSLSEVTKHIEGLIDSANAAIVEHNEAVANLASERDRLTREVWRHVLDEELRRDLRDYNDDRRGLVNAINGISEKIVEARAEREQRRREILALEKCITSVRPTVDAINRVLANFGFRDFRLQMVHGETAYQLVREDGSDAKETLSEGERTFVAFLYFFYRLRGSESESGTVQDRIVVFDDPVSSLDSDTLFVVATLIKKLCADVAVGTGNIKQVFILTHNVYFHRQVTHDYQRRNGRFTFWVLRKGDAGSSVTGYDSNPIRSSYELLWAELSSENRSNLAVQNAMRRILENYFGLLGGMSLDDLATQFEGDDQRICNSLISWMHAGSHGGDEDVFVAVDDSTIEAYLRVFRSIFEHCDQLPHYDMMMRRASLGS